MALGKRVKEARDAAGLTQAQLADRVGISQSAIHLLESRDSQSSKFLVELSKALGVSAEWLREGGMTVADMPRPYDLESPSSPSEETHVIIPRYNVHAACGNGLLNDHVEVNGGLAFMRSWIRDMGWKAANLVVIYARQDSMAPTITDGAVLLVDTSQTAPESGRVYVLNWFGEERVKRLHRVGASRYRVSSDNPNKAEFPDEVIDFEESPDVRIIGRVVWQGGTL